MDPVNQMKNIWSGGWERERERERERDSKVSQISLHQEQIKIVQTICAFPLCIDKNEKVLLL